MNTTELFFEKLASILEREYEAHERLLDAAAHMTGALTTNDLKMLDANTAEIDGQVSTIEALENERAACCAALSANLGIRDKGSLRLGTIIDRAPVRLKEKLAFLRASLRSTMRKIAHSNVANGVLLEEGLQFIRNRIALIGRAGVMRFMHYGGDGGRAAATLPFHPFVNKTV